MLKSIGKEIYATKVAYFNVLPFWGMANCDEMSGTNPGSGLVAKLRGLYRGVNVCNYLANKIS